MSAMLTEHRVDARLAARLGPVGAEVVIDWLGQAGFLLRFGPHRVLIDPYLSDTLAEKYRGSATPHERLMPPPITPADLGRVDLVLVTHHHTDHMDPGTLGPLATGNPDLRFIVPRASREEARRRIGVAEDRLILVDAGESVTPLPGFHVTAIRAAHETLERDADGHHRFLGYAVTVDLPAQPSSTPHRPHAEARGRVEDPLRRSVTIVHSGDTVPFEGQAYELAAFRPDLTLLPVNGRLPELAARNIAGNLTLDEAAALTTVVGAPAMVAHHFGMFAFNTLPLAAIEAMAADPALPIRLIPARTGLELRLWPA